MSRKTRPALKTDANFRDLAGTEFDTAFRGDYTGTNLIYAGFARPGAAEGDSIWKISRQTYDISNNITAIEWPQLNGQASNDYEFIWTNRAALTYS